MNIQFLPYLMGQIVAYFVATSVSLSPEIAAAEGSKNLSIRLQQSPLGTTNIEGIGSPHTLLNHYRGMDFSQLDRPQRQQLPSVPAQEVRFQQHISRSLPISATLEELKADNWGTEFSVPQQRFEKTEAEKTTKEDVNAESQNQTLTEEEVRQIQKSIDDIQTETDKQTSRRRSSPAITISNPAGFGADNFTAFANVIFQERVRRSSARDATSGFGIGFGDSRKNIGIQLSYSLVSFGQIGRSFGSGGFNAKIHRQFPGRWAVAVGTEGFLNIGDTNDFEDTFYGSVTKILNTRPEVSKPLSRLALTAGAGTGRFRSETDFVNDNNTVSPFASASVLVAPPVSTILEWTGQDLAVGLSIVPFRNIPLVISPSVRDIVGAGENPRFILGVGMSWQL